jgi:rhodanese-related sulfurtransferase
MANLKSSKGKKATKEEVSSQAKPPAPKGKETVLGLYVTAKEAYEMWKEDPDKVKIIDCRTTEEYLFIGHPPMAWNIPVAIQTYEWDADRKQFPMKPNPDFIQDMKRLFEPSDTLLVTCRAGGRACLAINALAQCGFKNAYNIIDGMEGDTVTDPESVFLGLKMKNGWRNSGLPWTYEIVPERVVIPKSIR